MSSRSRGPHDNAHAADGTALRVAPGIAGSSQVPDFPEHAFVQTGRSLSPVYDISFRRQISLLIELQHKRVAA